MLQERTQKSLLLSLVVMCVMVAGGAVGQFVNGNADRTVGYDCNWVCTNQDREDEPGECTYIYSPMPGDCDQNSEEGEECWEWQHCDGGLD